MNPKQYQSIINVISAFAVHSEIADLLLQSLTKYKIIIYFFIYWLCELFKILYSFDRII